MQCGYSPTFDSNNGSSRRFLFSHPGHRTKTTAVAEADIRPEDNARRRMEEKAQMERMRQNAIPVLGSLHWAGILEILRR